MEVLCAQSAGFCFGVSLALQKLDAALEAFAVGGGSGRFFTFGPIIHNPLVVCGYESRGVRILEDLDELEPGDRVVIRAHGVSRQCEAALRQSGAVLIDATCPKVKKAQLAIAEESLKKRRLFLLGEAFHPEVEGLLSYAGENACVFDSLASLETILEEHSGCDFFLAAQTTQDVELYQKCLAFLRERCSGRIPALKTICDATRKRQQEAVRLARKVDCMVVVGGLNSGNTRRLLEVTRAAGTAAMHVERPEELDLAILGKCRRVGLTAGASTPQAHILAMECFLKAL